MLFPPNGTFPKVPPYRIPIKKLKSRLYLDEKRISLLGYNIQKEVLLSKIGARINAKEY
jgi:hypothetical protein